VVSGAGVGVPVGINIVAGGGRVHMILFTIVVGVKTFVAPQGRVPRLATDLTWNFVAMAMHRATASSTTSIDSMGTNVLVLLLGLDSGLYSNVIEPPRGGGGFATRINLSGSR
jgi:hypothetical protein